MGKHLKEEKNSKKSIKIKGFTVFVLVIVLCAAIIAGYFAPKISKKIDSLGGGLTGITAMFLGHTEETRKNLGRINILLIGESGIDDYKLADTIMICSYDPVLQKASILSIPRDTYVGPNLNKASSIYKINTRYQSGEKMETLLNDLEAVTGLKIEYYIRVNTDALKKLVDLVGGVQFDVPIDMKYDDPGQNLHIDLKAGMQTITGEKAEQLLRFRHNNNGSTYSFEYGQEDFGRMKTQRAFIEAVLQQTLKSENLDKIKEIINIGYENIITNIDIDKIIDYLPYAIEFKTENLMMDDLPGQSDKCNGIWIFVHNKKATKELIQEMFLNDVAQEKSVPEITNS